MYIEVKRSNSANVDAAAATVERYASFLISLLSIEISESFWTTSTIVFWPKENWSKKKRKFLINEFLCKSFFMLYELEKQQYCLDLKVSATYSSQVYTLNLYNTNQFLMELLFERGICIKIFLESGWDRKSIFRSNGGLKS